MSSSFARFQFPPVDSLAGCSPLPDLSAVAVSLHRGLGGVCLVLSPFVVPALVVLLFLPVSPLYFLLDALFVHRFISFLAPVAIFALVPALSSSPCAILIFFAFGVFIVWPGCACMSCSDASDIVSLISDEIGASVVCFRWGRRCFILGDTGDLASRAGRRCADVGFFLYGGSSWLVLDVCSFIWLSSPSSLFGLLRLGVYS